MMLLAPKEQTLSVGGASTVEKRQRVMTGYNLNGLFSTCSQVQSQASQQQPIAKVNN
jgi:hypothetical protein